MFSYNKNNTTSVSNLNILKESSTNIRSSSSSLSQTLPNSSEEAPARKVSLVEIFEKYQFAQVDKWKKKDIKLI